MVIYILYIIFLIVARYSLVGISNEFARHRKETNLLYIAAGILLFLTAFRGASVGTDTRNYLAMYYYTIPMFDFASPWSGFESAPANFYLWKTLSMWGMPHQVLELIIEFVYVSAILRFINRFSKDRIISFLLFFVFELYSFSVPALKQTVAMGLVLHAFLDFLDHKYIRTIVLFVLAFFFHKSSLVFVGVLLICYTKRMKSIGILLVLAGFVVVVFGATFLRFFTNLLGDEHYIDYLTESGAINWVLFIYFFSLLIIAYLAFSDYKKGNYDECLIMYEMALVACVFQGMSYAVGESFRLAIYYLPAYLIIIPNIAAYSKKWSQLKPIMIILILLFYFYTSRDGENIIPYKFIWQDNEIPNVYFGG